MNALLFQTDTATVRARPRRVTVLGQKVDLITPREVLAFVAKAAERSTGSIIANHNLHSLYLVRRSEGMAALYRRADIVEVDSRPLLHWASLLGLPASGAHRCTYLDWRDDFWRMAAEKHWRVFYLGGAPGVAAKAADKLMRRWPGVEIAVQHGYFDRTPGSDENTAILEAIKAFHPHVLMVGMGMPIQEEWIIQNHTDLAAGVILPVGAAFDYEAGAQVAAPRLLGQLGLEWLFRLACDPRRLFRRYLIEPWSLMVPAAGDVGRYVVVAVPAARARRAAWRYLTALGG